MIARGSQGGEKNWGKEMPDRSGNLGVPLNGGGKKTSVSPLKNAWSLYRE